MKTYTVGFSFYMSQGVCELDFRAGYGLSDEEIDKMGQAIINNIPGSQHLYTTPKEQ